MSKSLEQRLFTDYDLCRQTPPALTGREMYSFGELVPRVDSYGQSLKATHMGGAGSKFFTAPFNKHPNPTGGDNITHIMDLSEILDDSRLQKYGLSERYDLSGHPGGEQPHLNQDIVRLKIALAEAREMARQGTLVSGFVERMRAFTPGKGGCDDGSNGLGPAHNMKLFYDPEGNSL